MINRNPAEATENSVAAINNSNGNQTIDNSTKGYVDGLANLAITIDGVILYLLYCIASGSKHHLYSIWSPHSTQSKRERKS